MTTFLLILLALVAPLADVVPAPIPAETPLAPLADLMPSVQGDDKPDAGLSIDIDTSKEKKSAWPVSPFWLSVIGIVLLLMILVAVVARRGGGGTTVLKS